MLFIDNRTVVVDIGSNVLKIIGLRRKNRLQVEFWRAVDIFKTGKINRPDDLNPTLIVQILREMLKPIRPAIRRVRIVLSSPGCMLRIIELPVLAVSEIKAAIRLSLYGLMPFEPEKVEFNYTTLSINREQKTQTLLVALVPTDEIGRQIEILQRAGLEPETVTTDQMAIYNCYHQLRSGTDNDSIAIVNIGSERTAICFYNPGNSPAFSALPVGGNTITRSIEKHFHTSFINAESHKIGAQPPSDQDSDLTPPVFDWSSYLSRLADQIAGTIHATILNQQIQNGDYRLSKILLTGGSARLRQLDYLLAEQLKVPVHIWNPFLESALNGLIEPEIMANWGESAAPALGLALEEAV